MLLEETPDNNQYKYERMLVLLSSGHMDAGFRELDELMEKTDQYDSVLYTVADIIAYVRKDKERAAEILRQYLEKFPRNPDAWKKLWEWTGDNKAKVRWERLSR
jgi:predicted Zn-dependent protease